MPDITLIRTRQAVPGFTFTYLGAAPACRTCPYRNACLTLEIGRRYEVKRVRPVTHPCALQEDEASVVEVAALPRPLVTEGDGVLVGSTIEVGRYPCGRMDCPNWEVCAGPSLAGKQRYQVRRVEEERTTCLIGRRLKRVEGI